MLISVIILIILIGINGIFSSSELAFLSIDKLKLFEEVEKNNKKALRIKKLLEDTSSFLSTIQIGITLAGFLASAFAADYFVDYFMNVINIAFISKSLQKTLLVIIVTIVLSYFTLIFGELVPKKIAINNPFKISCMFVNIINVVCVCFKPLIKLLTKSAEFICKIFKIKEKQNKLSEDDIKKIIIQGNSEGIIEEKEKEYILNVFNFNDKEVSNVMTPKKNVVTLSANNSIKENILKIKESKYSRYPVYKNNENNIIGILNVKDLILEKSINDNIKIEEIIRPVSKILHNDKIDDVFRSMQNKNESMCVIYDDKEFVGIVTIEDAVEEIVGNIYDEYDSII